MTHSAKQTRALPVILAAALAIPFAGCAEATAEHPAAGIYLNYCSSCHGVALEGRGTGGSLRVADLDHGSDKESIFRSIHDGILHMGMPGYGNALSDEQITDLVDYIIRYEDLGDAALPEQEQRSYDRIRSLDYEIAKDVWVSGLEVPWAIAFLDDRRALITERPGRLRLVEDGVLIQTAIQGTPDVLAAGQGGMLDVVTDPEYDENGWIYLSYSHPLEDNRAMTKVVRGRIDGENWVDEETVFEAPHDTYLPTRQHYGSRIAFCEEGYLYFTIGDRGRMRDAQRLDVPQGKVHRVHRDGSIPEDNPFVNRDDAMPSIYTYGNRNPQGIARHPVTGDIWSTEHGPRGGDELNLVRPGINYGWPVISYGINYDGSVLTERRRHPDMEQPMFVWTPSTGTCGMTFYVGDEFPYWNNHLLVGGLATEDLRLLTMENDRVIHEEVLFRGFERVRDVRVGPDGAVYVVLNNNAGEVLRLTNTGSRGRQ